MTNEMITIVIGSDDKLRVFPYEYPMLLKRAIKVLESRLKATTVKKPYPLQPQSDAYQDIEDTIMGRDSYVEVEDWMCGCVNPLVCEEVDCSLDDIKIQDHLKSL